MGMIMAITSSNSIMSLHKSVNVCGLICAFIVSVHAGGVRTLEESPSIHLYY